MSEIQECLQSFDPGRFVHPRASRISGLEIPPPRTTPLMLCRWAEKNGAKFWLSQEDDCMTLAHIDAGNGIICTAIAREAEAACSELVCKLLDEAERIQNKHPQATVRSAARLVAASVIHAVSYTHLTLPTNREV